MPESAAKKDVPILPAVDSAEGSAAGLTFLQFMRMVLRPIASLRLTVVLFSLCLFLVFFGTLAQIKDGVWTVVDKYFYSEVVWIPLQLIAEFCKVFFRSLGFPQDATWGGSFPFPGGFTLGWALLANLVAAHLVRFRISWKRSGILLIHSGVAVLLIGEYVTRKYAVESTMTIAVGETVNFVERSLAVELAVIDRSDPKIDDVVVIPQRLLKKKGLIQHPDLPVDLRVTEYHKNSDVRPLRAESDTVPDELVAADGQRYQVLARDEAAGVDPNQKHDAPMMRIEALQKGSDEVLRTFLLTLWQYPNFTNRQIDLPAQKLTVGDKEYALELRPKREYKPYSVTLLKFEHAVYPGTDVPKDFASTVRLEDPERNQVRDQVRIWMNHPLTHRGQTFYQSSYLPGDVGTVLQVVRNPGGDLPYWSCLMIAGGMVLHFGIHLIGFLGRRAVA
jgi:ResB-like family